MLKKNVCLILATVMFAQVTQVYAAVGNITPITSGGNVLADSGDYNINQVTQNNTQVMMEVIKSTNLAAAIDREYIAGIAERMNSKLSELNSLRVKLVKMSTSLTQVQLQDYLNVVNEVNEKNEALTLDLATSTSLTRESLPSYSPVEVGNMKATVNTAGNVDLSPLTKRIEAARNELLQRMNNTKIENRIVTPLGHPFQVSSNALTPNMAGVRILTRDQIKQYNQEIQEAMTLDEDTIQYQRDMVDYTVNVINQFVTNYGTSEWLRFTNENDMKAQGESFKKILDVFARRSYLRKKYGMRMGAIQSQGYPKQIVNLESFGLQPIKEAVKSFRRDAAVSDTELSAAFESARQFVELYDQKITPVLKSGKDIMLNKDKQLEYSSKDTGFIVKANSAVTYLTGQRHTAEILLSIMRFVLSDIREEMMLASNENEAMKQYHDSKYRATAELKKENNTRICQIDYTLSQAVHDANCKALVAQKAKRATIVRGDTISEIFGAMMSQIETVEKGRRQDAAQKQKLVEAALEAGNDKGAQDENDGGLFN